MNSKLDSVTQCLIDDLCAVKVDVYSIARSIKTCCRILEVIDHNIISINTRHRLCRSLTISYFIFLEQETNFPEILSYIRTCLTCMGLLKQSSIASHILCQALLERSLSYAHLFNPDYTPLEDKPNIDSLNDDCIRLLEENHKATLGHRFRRLQNYSRIAKNKQPTKQQQSSNTKQVVIKKKEQEESSNKPNIPDKKSINCYLLNEAFKSSINNMEAFATLFVEFHCPVTFDVVNWPSDDALRVTNEKNLSILRKFESIPPFWDVYELIGQFNCLGSCLTLVKALFTANLALWSSATTNSQSDKMSSTLRLIPPLAQSGLIPKAFGRAVHVFPHFASTEVFAVLTDIWSYLKDTYTSQLHQQNTISATSRTDVKFNKAKDKIYLNKLRLFMCQHTPGKEYVMLFKEFHDEQTSAAALPAATAATASSNTPAADSTNP